MLALAFYLEGGGTLSCSALAFYLEGGGETLSCSALAFFSWGVGGGGVLELMKRGASAEAI